MFDFEECFTNLRHGYDIAPAISLKDIADDVQTLHITKNTKDLDFLPKFKKLRFINAHNIKDEQFKHICTASQITHLGANVCDISNLDSLSNLVNLEAIELTDNTKITSLKWLSALTKLQVFALVNFLVTVNLDPLSACTDLRYIWLSSRYSKSLNINSLKALSELKSLEYIKFKNVRVKDQKLDSLYKLKKLIEVDIPDLFPHEEFIKLSDALPNARGHWLDKHKEKTATKSK